MSRTQVRVHLLIRFLITDLAISICLRGLIRRHIKIYANIGKFLNFVKIYKNRGDRDENGVKIDIGIIDTPGFGRNLDLKSWYKIVKKEIVSRFDNYKQQKREIDQKNIGGNFDEILNDEIDCRIHLILYFTSSTTINLEESNYIKKLTRISNTLPIFSKGDYHTQGEIIKLKARIMRESAKHGCRWFNCEESLKDYPDKLELMLKSTLGACPPFLVINANDVIINEDMKRLHGRKYSWGVCDIENPDHTDF